MPGAEGRSRVTAIIFAGLALAALGAPHVLLLSAGASMMLTRHGVEALSAVYLGAGLLLLPFGWVVAQFVKRFDAERALILILGFRVSVAFGLFALWYLGYDGFVAYAAPLWARVDLVIGAVSLWKVAGKLFAAPGDRRWLGWFAVCEPISTFAVGLIAPLLLSFASIGVAYLAAALILLAALPPAYLIRAELAAEIREAPRRSRRRRGAHAERRLSPSLRTYLALVVVGMLAWVMAHYMLDALFHGLVAERFASEARRFSFFAYTLGAAGGLSLGFLLFAQGPLMRRYGVRLLLVVLPMVLLVLIGIGLVGDRVFGIPVALFIGVAVMKIIEYAMVSGFYTRAWRSLFAPLPETHRKRLIHLVERNVHVAGVTFAAVALIDILRGGFDGATLGFIFTALAGVGLVISWFVQKGYDAALERGLMRHQTFDEVDVGGADRRSRQIIQKMLREGGSTDAIEALRLQAALDVDGFVHTAPRLIARGERNLVKSLLDTVKEVARPELYPPMAGRLTVEEDGPMRDSLLIAAAATGHPRSPRLLARSLAETPDQPPLGALIGLGRHGGAYGAAVAGQFLERYARSGDDELSHALEAATAIGPAAPAGPVAEALRSDDPLLRRRAIRAAGKIGDPTLAPLLIEQLADPREWRAAMLALSNLGAGAVDALAQTIGDRASPLRRRAAAMRALGDIQEPEAREQLLLHARSLDRRLRRHAHLALWRSGVIAPRDLAPDLAAHAEGEMRQAAEALVFAADLAAIDSRLLTDGLNQRSQRAAVCAVRACGLTKPRSGLVEARLSALFGLSRDWSKARIGVDLMPDDLRTVFEHVAAPQGADALSALRAVAGGAPLTASARLAEMLTGDRWRNDWLRAVAHHHLAAHDPAALDALGDLGDGAGPYLTEEIKRRSGVEGGEMALSTVEKILILKAADLFAQVPDEDLAEIAPYLTPVYLDPGETIITEGEMGDELYIIVSGEVKVMKGGVEVVRQGEKAVFGDLAALDPEPRNATVVATTPTQVLALSNEHLLSLFEANVEIASGVIATLIRRLRAEMG